MIFYDDSHGLAADDEIDLAILIMSGFCNGGGSPTNSFVPLDFTGAGPRLADELLTTSTGLALFGVNIGILAYAI